MGGKFLDHFWYFPTLLILEKNIYRQVLHSYTKFLRRRFIYSCPGDKTSWDYCFLLFLLIADFVLTWDGNSLVLLGVYHLLSKLFIYTHIIFLGRQGSIEKTSNKCFFWTVEWARSITELWFTDFAWLWSSSWTFLWSTGPNLFNTYLSNDILTSLECVVTLY